MMILWERKKASDVSVNKCHLHAMVSSPMEKLLKDERKSSNNAR